MGQQRHSTKTKYERRKQYYETGFHLARRLWEDNWWSTYISGHVQESSACQHPLPRPPTACQSDGLCDTVLHKPGSLSSSVHLVADRNAQQSSTITLPLYSETKPITENTTIILHVKPHEYLRYKCWPKWLDTSQLNMIKWNAVSLSLVRKSILLSFPPQ